MKKTPLLLLLFSALCSTAFADATLSFSGGNGAPLTITLSQPILYHITSNQALAGDEPYFVFQNAAPTGGGPFLSAPGSGLTFSINSGVLQGINNAGNGSGAIGSSNLFMSGPFSTLVIGDVVVLNAGTYTSSGAVAAPAPANGTFPTYIINRIPQSNAQTVSDFGTWDPLESTCRHASLSIL